MRIEVPGAATMEGEGAERQILQGKREKDDGSNLRKVEKAFERRCWHHADRLMSGEICSVVALGMLNFRRLQT